MTTNLYRKWTVIGCYIDGEPAVVGVVAGHVQMSDDSGYGLLSGAEDRFADQVEADSAYEAECQVYATRSEQAAEKR